MATARIDLSSANVVVVPEMSGIAAPEPTLPQPTAQPSAIPKVATATTSLIPDVMWAFIAVAGVVVTAFAADALASDAGFPAQQPPAAVDGLVLFAVFYVAAQAIERLLEPFSSLLLPNQDKTKEADEAAAAARKAIADAEKGTRDNEGDINAAKRKLDEAAKQKAELAALNGHRTILFWGVATALGIVASAGMKLYFLQRAGIPNSSRWWEILATGLIIGAGTKPLHDLIEFISSKKESAERQAARAQ